MPTVPRDEFDALMDHADDVSREAWGRLAGHDATAALAVLGTLLAATEKQLGWSRDRVLQEISNIADTCVRGQNSH